MNTLNDKLNLDRRIQQERRKDYEAKGLCYSCLGKGKGHLHDGTPWECKRCNGTGKVRVRDDR